MLLPPHVHVRVGGQARAVAFSAGNLREKGLEGGEAEPGLEVGGPVEAVGYGAEGVVDVVDDFCLEEGDHVVYVGNVVGAEFAAHVAFLEVCVADEDVEAPVGGAASLAHALHAFILLGGGEHGLVILLTINGNAQQNNLKEK